MFESKIEISSKDIYGSNDTILRAPKGVSPGFSREPRDRYSIPLPSNGIIYPRGDWDELAALQDKNHTSMYHVHKGRIDIKNQRSTSLCWCFGAVTGVETQYVAAGMPQLNFSPTSTALLTNGYKNEGGWGFDALRGVQQYGIADYDHWPNVSFSRDHYSKESVKSNMKRHNVIGFNDLGRYNFDAVMSALLCPIDPRPVTGGFSHWGHLVILLQAVKVSGKWGVLFANSWGSDWGESGGYGILLGDKAIPTEALSIGRIKPRSE